MSKKATQKRVKVLYQNLNGTWYAFAETGAGIYFGKVPVQATAKMQKNEKNTSARKRTNTKDAA